MELENRSTKRQGRIAAVLAGCLRSRRVSVALRRALLVSLDDLLAVVREFLNPDVFRSGLDRCLRRHGVGNLRDLQAKDPRPKRKAFKAYEPGDPLPGR